MKRNVPAPSPRRLAPTALALVLSATLAACGGSGGGSSGDDGSGDSDDPDNAGGQSGGGAGDQQVGPAVIEGNITRYGVVNVADEAGQASEAIAAFNAVTPGVGALAFGTAVDTDGQPCEVVPSSSGGNDLLLMGFAPAPRGAQSRSIMAGETVTLTADGGTWATLTADAASAVSFYDGPVPEGAVPTAMQVDVSAASDADGFPGFAMASLPTVTGLNDFTIEAGPSIDAGTRFSWTASDDPASRVRIVASTGFFSDDPNGKRVSCLVPDTGSFSFPSAVRDELGETFQGDLFVASRLAISTQQTDEAVLFLVRESFSAD